MAEIQLTVVYCDRKQKNVTEYLTENLLYFKQEFH